MKACYNWLMELKRRRRRKIGIWTVTVFVLVGVGAFVGMQFFAKTGIFRVPGIVYYDESLSSEQLEILQGIFTEEVKLDKDVYISAYNSLSRPDLGESEYIYNIEVPVTDFYDERTDRNEFDEV